jgi:hypothetical protein
MSRKKTPNAETQSHRVRVEIEFLCDSVSLWWMFL